MLRILVRLMLVLMLSGTGCSYLSERAKDFNDQFVYNFGVGVGLNTHLRVTRWAQTGIGAVSYSSNAGYINRTVGFSLNEEYDLSGLIAGFLVSQVAAYTPELDSDELRLMSIPLSYGRGIRVNKAGGTLYANYRKTYRSVQDKLKEFQTPDDKSVVDLFKGMDYYDGNVAIFYNLNPLRDKEGRLKFRLVEQFSIEAKAAAFIVSVRLGYNPVETADFALGLVGVDLCEDDAQAVFSFPIRRVLEKPVREIIRDERDYK